MPIFYLETSALRRMASHLHDPLYTQHAFTSCLAVFELLSGIDTTNFSTRRSILAKVSQSGLAVDWDMPPDKLCSAFTPNPSGSIYADEIRKILRAVLESDTLEQADQACKKAGHGVAVNGLRFIDETLSTNHVRDYQEGIRRFRSDWTYKTADALYRFTHGQLHDGVDLPNELQQSLRERSTSSVLMALCYGLASHFFPAIVQEKMLELYLSYDGSLSYYLAALAYYQENRLVYSKIPAHNDFLDLEHFVYLRSSRSVRMVSDDKLISGICHALWPRKGYTSDGFLCGDRTA